ncbi:probable LRR receptor-like serine threonine-kinase At2g24230 [Olea europaea subsp. europaea]|uniref:Probable LRR receptor-like serine threonine-kinase At2g24230 n=1 Tax=Olea europaea subsp. europaea TaxID=158383 RepID=A0A8S0T1F4_OLEEU|nr:probable LRR receptor-like serine threonine-kinase At2g24230 [Olea europaea subsp. europaea]
MGFGFLGSFLLLTLFFKPLVSEQPNTDGSFIFDFLQKMYSNSSKDYNFSGPFCSWRGVSCDTKRENVVKLEATSFGLSGVIPDNTIGKLTKLETLDLSSNKITALPSDFWSLGTLKNLNLSFNQFSGNLPSSMGNFGRLQSLDLSFNNFSGSIPEAISSLVSLQVLNLSQNGFDSTIPLGISQCRSLVSIDLSKNKLNGSLPRDFGAALTKLEFLNLAVNEIEGRDTNFLGMKFIRYLNISGNLFKGSVVDVFEGPLEVIDLSRNQFQGHIAEVNFSSTFNWSKLVYLDLSGNQLSGKFFSGLIYAPNLKYLNLAQNRFTKQQFLSINMLFNLEYLNLSSTNLIGEIPSNISYLSSLKTLDLSKNHLRNHIPPFGIKNLQVLDVSYNNLTGDIPLMLLGGLREMERFNFSYNNLSFCGSQIPSETLQSAFIGSMNSCPIAANPAFFKRKSQKHRGLKLALALTLSMVSLLVGLLFLAFGCRRKTRNWTVKQNSYKEEQTISGPFSFQTDSTTWVADVKQATSVPVVIFEKPLLNFTFADLLTATCHFDRGSLLAEGRFGPVYGGLLPGGVHVAVTVLVHGSIITDDEAARELEYLGRIKHPNLVPLTGYCLAGEQRIAIYEYMENGNLQNLLYDLPLGVQTTEDWTNDTWEEDENNGIQNVGTKGSLITWRFRHKIALGTARALAFLHHGCSPPIIHKDVKASSVYLDSNLEPRISDFGLARIFGNEPDSEIAGGSPGYVPPEFLQPETSSLKDPSPKSDVYGFGVILFELITGKKPVEDDYPDEKEASLISWVRGLVRTNHASQAIDPKIRGTGPEEQIVEALKIGYLCTAELPSKRPSMQQVVGLLKDLEPITQK